jgi:hypothetical protein
VKTVSDNVALVYLFTGIYLLWQANAKFRHDKLYHLLPCSDAVRRDKQTKMSVDDIQDMLIVPFLTGEKLT